MTKTPSTKPNLSKKVRVSVSGSDIHSSECLDPNRCMIKVSMARALRVPHGYIHVDSTGISVTRRRDYREKAFLPRIAARKMLEFDREAEARKKGLPSKVTPFQFTVEFHKTSKVVKSTQERKDRINELRQRRSAAGIKPRKYSLHQRVVGIAFPKDLV